MGAGSASPLRVAVLCSHRAPGLDVLLRRSREPDAPYRVVACASSDPECGESGLLAEAGLPLRVVDIHSFYGERRAPVSDRGLRVLYDRRVLDAIRDSEPDALLLCGYLYVASSMLLDAFPGRVVNVHHSDLERRGPDGRPLYRGLRAVRDAILAGETETRSTVHLATSEVDEGPILARSEPFPVHPLLVEDARRRGREDVLKAYAYAHREWMMAESWGPLLDRALDRLARGEVRAREERVLRLERPPADRRGLRFRRASAGGSP